MSSLEIKSLRSALFLRELFLKHSSSFLEERNLLGDYSLYKVACSYPLVDDLLLPYLKIWKNLLSLKKKEAFLETELREFIDRHGLNLKVYGKSFRSGDGEKEIEGFPAFGGLSYEILQEKIEKLMKLLHLERGKKEEVEFETWDSFFPKRLPTFCPGCPHRETLSLLKDLGKVLKEKRYQPCFSW